MSNNSFMLHLCVCQDMKHSGSLECTQEAMVARSELLRLVRALQTTRASYLDIRTLTHELISLACVSSETHNLQRVFCPGGIPLYRLHGYVRRQRVSVVFHPFWSETGYQF